MAINMMTYNGRLCPKNAVALVRTDDGAGDMKYETVEVFSNPETMHQDAADAYNARVDGAEGDGVWIYGLAAWHEGKQLVAHPKRPVTVNPE
jgi:hypothetical protein